nr:MAG TPA: hypothetical protein [Caudoviricetes sp.]
MYNLDKGEAYPGTRLRTKQPFCRKEKNHD